MSFCWMVFEMRLIMMMMMRIFRMMSESWLYWQKVCIVLISSFMLFVLMRLSMVEVCMFSLNMQSVWLVNVGYVLGRVSVWLILVCVVFMVCLVLRGLWLLVLMVLEMSLMMMLMLNSSSVRILGSVLILIIVIRIVVYSRLGMLWMMLRILCMMMCVGVWGLVVCVVQKLSGSEMVVLMVVVMMVICSVLMRGVMVWGKKF